MQHCRRVASAAGPAAAGRRAFGSTARLSAATPLTEMSLQRYELPQWAPDRRRRRHRPRELAMWDRLREYPTAPTSFTVTDLVTQQADAHPHKDIYTALKTEDKHDWDFPFLSYLSRGAAAGLLELGFKKGYSLVTWCDNSPEMLLLALGAPQAGAVHVALPADAPVDAVKRVLLEENARTLFFDQRHGKEYRLDSIKEIFPGVDDLSQINWIQSKRYRALKQFINVTGEDSYRATLTWRSFPVYDAEPQPVDQIRKYLHADDPAFVEYRLSTNGTDLERLAPVSSAHLLLAGEEANRALGLSSEDRVLATAPLSTKFGLAAGVYGPLQVGAKIVHPERRFKADETLNAIDKQRPSVLVMTADQLEAVAAMATEKSKESFVLSSVQKLLIDTSRTDGKLPQHPFQGAQAMAVDTAAMMSADVPFKLCA